VDAPREPPAARPRRGAPHLSGAEGIRLNAAPEPVGVLGAGAWGTALANLAAANGHRVALWCRRPELAGRLARDRRNDAYLSSVELHANVHPTADLAEALAGARLVLGVVPSHGTRDVVSRARPWIEPAAIVVSATKGIENETLLRMTQVLEQVLPQELHGRLGVLSGPSFAREVSEGRPTAVTLAAREERLAEEARRYLAGPRLRIYTSNDVVGAELGGALKNVIAIAAGMAEGLGAGLNGRAALITRGMAEIFRLGRVLGAEPLTLSGLAGMGDLILTCTSASSRNYTVGLRLGCGETLAAILADMQQVAEGVRTAQSAYDLARGEGVEMPIVNEVYHILYKDKSPADAVSGLMSRESKSEFWT
jgi:glycerol-3-phosphate dehydrogenase (NAD(P)+)